MSSVQGVALCSCKDTPKGTGVQSQWRDGKGTGVPVIAAVVGDVWEVNSEGESGDAEKENKRNCNNSRIHGLRSN